MLPASAPNQYANMEYNNEHHNLHSNGKILALKIYSISALNSPSVISTNDKGSSLFSPIHEKNKY